MVCNLNIEIPTFKQKAYTQHLRIPIAAAGSQHTLVIAARHKQTTCAKIWCYFQCDLISAIRFRRMRGQTSKASDMPIKMRYGRKDCNGKPREKAKDFPDPRMGLDGTLQWCRQVFNFTHRECVAIMGKETIGITFFLPVTISSLLRDIAANKISMYIQQLLLIKQIPKLEIPFFHSMH
mgnify:CR=1 FL=1